MSIDIEVATVLTPEVRDVWLDLVPADRWGFFCHPDWCEAVWTHFGPPKDLRILIARDEDGPAGVLPVWTRRMNRWGLFLPVGECFGTRRGDYGGFAVRDGPGAHLVVSALLDAAVASPGKWGTLIWPNLPDEDPNYPSMDRWCDDRGTVFISEEKQGWVVEIGGRSYDEVASDWTSKFRNNMNRYRRKLEEELGPVDFEVIRERDRVLEMLPAYFEMHNRRWVESGSPGTFTDPKMRDFFSDLVRRFADSHLHFSVLRAGGTPVAYHFGFFYGGYLLLYTPTYDLDYSGAGMVLQRTFIEEGGREGWSGVDLLQGDYAYKERMASRSTTTRSYLMRTHALAPGHFWITKGRPVLQKRFGGAIFRAVGRWDAMKRRLSG